MGNKHKKQSIVCRLLLRAHVLQETEEQAAEKFRCRNQPDLPSSFAAMEFQFCGPYCSTSCRSFSSSPGRQCPLGHDDGDLEFALSDVVVVDDGAIPLDQVEEWSWNEASRNISPNKSRITRLVT
jgi:hypothetical protein